LIRNVEEEEVMKLLKQIIENNMMLLNLQRQILELQIVEDQKRKSEQEEEWSRRKRTKKKKRERRGRRKKKSRRQMEKSREDKNERRKKSGEGMEMTWKRRREKNKEITMQERKCFVCGGFGHIAYNCRNIKNRREGGSILIPSNNFEVLGSKVMNIGEGTEREIGKDRKTILKEERLRKEKSVEVQKTRVEKNDNGVEKKEKLLRKIMVKIGLNQKEEEEGIVVQVLLD